MRYFLSPLLWWSGIVGCSALLLGFGLLVKIHLYKTALKLGGSTTNVPTTPDFSRCGVKGVPAAGRSVAQLGPRHQRVSSEEETSAQLRIVGGEPVTSAEYPWVVRVTNNGAGHIPACAGFLINEEYVLASGACLVSTGSPVSTEDLLVEYGQITGPDGNLNTTVENATTLLPFEFSNIQASAFVLLKLSSPVQFSEEVRPICLPTLAAANGSYVGQTAVVAGYGATDAAMDPNPSNQLHAATYDIVNTAPGCFSLLNQLPSMCLEGGAMSPCVADAGAPIQQEVDGVCTVIGVAGADCSLFWPHVQINSTVLQLIADGTGIAIQ